MYQTQIYKVSKIPLEIVSAIIADLKMIEISRPENLPEHSLHFDMYDEQLFHIGRADKNSYFVVVMKDNIYLGGVMLFLKGNYFKQYPIFQGIAKSLAGVDENFKLNSLLIPFIVQFLKDKGYNIVYCNPLDKQRDILLKHYDFKLVNDNEDILVGILKHDF